MGLGVGGGLTKNIYLKSGLGQFADLRGAWSKRVDGVSEGGWYHSEHYAIFC